MSRAQQTAYVLVQFRSMGASVFQLVHDAKRLMTDDAYLEDWYSFLRIN
jgi:hypothetical protein